MNYRSFSFRYFALNDCKSKEYYKEDPVFYINNVRSDAWVDKYSNINEVIEFCMNILIDINDNEYSEELHILVAYNNNDKAIIDNINNEDIYKIILHYRINDRQKMLKYLKNNYDGRLADLLNTMINKSINDNKD